MPTQNHWAATNLVASTESCSWLMVYILHWYSSSRSRWLPHGVLTKPPGILTERTHGMYWQIQKKGRRMGEGWKPPWNVYFLHQRFSLIVACWRGFPLNHHVSNVESADWFGNFMMATWNFQLSWILQHQVLLPTKLAWTRYRFHLHANQQQRFQGPPAKPRWSYLSNLKVKERVLSHGHTIWEAWC